LDDDAVAYYRLTEGWNAKFWSRFGGPPSLDGAICLDLGCGVGALSADIARLGAAAVTGIDPDRRRIEIASAAVAELHPEVAERVKFQTATIHDLQGAAKFDFVFTRDTFEHIHDLAAVLGECHRLLRPGGSVWAGFGPLYRSPFGDHGLLGLHLPWAHLIVAPSPTAPRIEAGLGDRLSGTARELNGLTFEEIAGILERCPLEVASLRVNVSSHPLMRLLSMMRRVPRLTEYFTVNVYAVLRRPGTR
ncbi:MAG: methyltransferase domain-containing protein, partial [Candidatus Limnocylindrales bacterium]